MRAVLSRVPEGVWVMQFRSVRCPERSIFYRQRCSSSNLHTVSLSFHKSTKRLMFLKNNSETKTWLNWGGKKKSKEASFAHRFLHRHTHSHSYTWKKLLYTRKTEWLQKSFSQKLLRKLLQWQTNTLGAPSYERRFFFPSGGYILYSKHPNLSCGQHPKEKESFWINQPLQTKGLRGMYTSMQKYQERQRPRNHLSLPAKRCFEGAAFSNNFAVCWLLWRTWTGFITPPLPSFKTVFSFLDIKTRKSVHSQCLQYTIPTHLWKTRRGLMGKADLYTRPSWR